MSTNNNNGSAELKNIICEAAGCYSKANNRVAVKVGSKGTIFLFLCDGCKPKFCSEECNCNQSKLESSSK